jgi:four helix bundle protein
MTIQKFEDIIAWQKSQDLAVAVYATFKELKDWDFKNQICSAAVSVSNNIAEGFDRNSDPEFKRFLSISRASCSEVKSMLYLAARLNYIDQASCINLLNQSSEVSRIINGFMKSLSSH